MVGTAAGSGLPDSNCEMVIATASPATKANDSAKRSWEWNCSSGNRSLLAMQRKVPAQNASAQPTYAALESATLDAPIQNKNAPAGVASANRAFNQCREDFDFPPAAISVEAAMASTGL